MDTEKTPPPPFKIQQLYAFIATDAMGVEGVMAFVDNNGNWLPMVGADLSRIESLRPVAQAMADSIKVKVKLALFSVREDKETIRG